MTQPPRSNVCSPERLTCKSGGKGRKREGERKVVMKGAGERRKQEQAEVC